MQTEMEEEKRIKSGTRMKLELEGDEEAARRQQEEMFKMKLVCKSQKEKQKQKTGANATTSHDHRNSSSWSRMIKLSITIFIICHLTTGPEHQLWPSRSRRARPEGSSLVVLVEAGSKSKEKSSKTTVIAISGGGGGKAHPVPVPWPVIHCHHHHHHMKYIPKPVLVHHWVKKYKPDSYEGEASSNEQRMHWPPEASHQQQHMGPVQQAAGNSLRPLVAHMDPPGLPFDGQPSLVMNHNDNLMQNHNLMHSHKYQLDASQLNSVLLGDGAQQAPLPHDLMDGGRLVAALSRTLDASHSQLHSQAHLQARGRPLGSAGAPPSLAGGHQQLAGRAPRHRPAGGPRQQERLLGEIERELKRLHQKQQQQQSKQKSHGPSGLAGGHKMSGQTLAMDFPKSAGHAKVPPPVLDAEPVDSLRDFALANKTASSDELEGSFGSSNSSSGSSKVAPLVIEASTSVANSTEPPFTAGLEGPQADGMPETVAGEQPGEPLSQQTLALLDQEARRAATYEAGAPLQLAFDEQSDQLRAHSHRLLAGNQEQPEVVASGNGGQLEGASGQADFSDQYGLASELNRANQLEASESMRAFERVSREQASKLALLQQPPFGTQLSPFGTQLSPFGGAHLAPAGATDWQQTRMQPAASSSVFRAQVAPPALQQRHSRLGAASPLQGAARAAAALAESGTIDLMTRLAGRLSQMEAASLIEKQLRQARQQQERPPTSTNPGRSSGELRGFRSRMLSLFGGAGSLTKGTRDRRRSGGSGALETRLKVELPAGLQPPRVHLPERFGANGRRPPMPSQLGSQLGSQQSAAQWMLDNQRLVRRQQLASQRAQQSAQLMAAPSSEHIITASPLNLSLIAASQPAASQPTGDRGRPSNWAASTRLMAPPTSTSATSGSKAEALLPAASTSEQKQVAAPPPTQPVQSAASAPSLTGTTSGPRAEPQAQPQPQGRPSTTNASALMSADQEDRFYAGQREHLLRLRQTHSSGAVPSHPASSSLASQPAGSGAGQLFSSQSSNVQQSVTLPTDDTSALAPSSARQQQASASADAASQPQSPPSPEGQPQTGAGPEAGAFLEFPMSPQQWSREALRSLNQAADSQQQQQQQEAASEEPSAAGSAGQAGQSGQWSAGAQEEQSAGDEEEPGSGQSGAGSGEQTPSAEEETVSSTERPSELVHYELVGDQLGPQSLAEALQFGHHQHQAQQQQMAAAFASSQLSPQMVANGPPMLQWRPPPASPHFGPFFAAGYAPLASAPEPAGLGELQLAQLADQRQQMLSAASSLMQPVSSLDAQSLATAGELSLAQFPRVSAGRAAKLNAKAAAFKGPQLPAAFGPSLGDPLSLRGAQADMQQLRQFQTGLGSAVAAQANNLTGMALLTGNLRNQMQNLQSRLPQMPNIPQPPQMPNLPMPPPGMMQMAASVALPLAMARATRNSNRFRNNQINAAASAGGASAGQPVSPAQRLIRGTSQLASRLMRPRNQRRRPPSTTRVPSAAPRPLANRQPAAALLAASSLRLFGRPAATPTRVPSTRVRRPALRLLQTVVDMSRSAGARPAGPAGGAGVRGVAKSAASLAAAAATSAASAAAAASAGKPAGAPAAVAAVASAASSALASAAQGPADRIRPKSDEDSMRVARLGRSLALRLHQLPLGFGQRVAQSAATEQSVSATSASGVNVVAGRPRRQTAGQTDGKLAQFKATSSPADQLERQLRRRARELQRAQLHNELQPLGHELGQLQQLYALANQSAQLAHQWPLPAELHESVEPLDRQRLSYGAETAAHSPPQRLAAHQRLAGFPRAGQLPLIANHINLLMFTAQNVTGNLAPLKPAAQAALRQGAAASLIRPQETVVGGELGQDELPNDQEQPLETPAGVDQLRVDAKQPAGQQQQQQDRQDRQDHRLEEPQKSHRPTSVQDVQSGQTRAEGEPTSHKATPKEQQAAPPSQQAELPAESTFIEFSRALKAGVPTSGSPSHTKSPKWSPPSAAPAQQSSPATQKAAPLIEGSSTPKLRAPTGKPTRPPTSVLQTTQLATTTQTPTSTTQPPRTSSRAVGESQWVPTIQPQSKSNHGPKPTKQSGHPKSKRSTDKPRPKTKNTKEAPQAKDSETSSAPEEHLARAQRELRPREQEETEQSSGSQEALLEKAHQEEAPLERRQDEQQQPTSTEWAARGMEERLLKFEGQPDGRRHEVDDYIRAIKLVRGVNYPWPPPRPIII